MRTPTSRAARRDPSRLRRSLALAALAGVVATGAACVTACASGSPEATSVTPRRTAANGPDSTGSLDDALRAREQRIEAERRDRPRRGSVIVSEEPWTYAGRSGRLITTPHFRIHTTVQRSLLLERTPDFAELALASYRSALGDLPEPGEKLDTFVMHNRAEWESITRTIAGEQASTYLRIPRGGFALRGKGVYYDIGPRDTLSIAAHEGWHQYTQATFRHPLPLWLEEGIAAYFEGFRWDRTDRTLPVFLPWSNPQRFDTLRDAVAENKLMPLGEILVSRPQDLLERTDGRALVYYSQVWALAHFLHEGAGAAYRDDLARLLLDAAEGRLYPTLAREIGERNARRTLGRRIGDGVFRVYFNEDLDEAQREYERFIRAATLPGTRGDMTAGRSPLEDE